MLPDGDVKTFSASGPAVFVVLEAAGVDVEVVDVDAVGADRLRRTPAVQGPGQMSEDVPDRRNLFVGQLVGS